MAIIQLPENRPMPPHLDCAICGEHISPGDATVGLLDADNHLCFACGTHFRNLHQLIVGWADFLANQRARRMRHQFKLEYGEAPDAWAQR